MCPHPGAPNTPAISDMIVTFRHGPMNRMTAILGDDLAGAVHDSLRTAAPSGCIPVRGSAFEDGSLDDPGDLLPQQAGQRRLSRPAWRTETRNTAGPRTPALCLQAPPRPGPHFVGTVSAHCARTAEAMQALTFREARHGTVAQQTVWGEVDHPGHKPEFRFHGSRRLSMRHPFPAWRVASGVPPQSSATLEQPQTFPLDNYREGASKGLLAVSRSFAGVAPHLITPAPRDDALHPLRSETRRPTSLLRVR